MRRQLFILPFILLASCRTPAETKSSSDLAYQPYTKAGQTMPIKENAKPELLLQKIVGRLPEDNSKTQTFDCKLMSDEVSNLAQVKNWIDEVEKSEMSVAYLFVAITPSIEIFAYKGDKKILVLELASVRQYPKPNDPSGLKNTAAEELIKLIDKKCPVPK